MLEKEPTEMLPSIETGIEVIDSQHQILISTLNKAAEKLGEDNHADIFDQITRDLLAYALYHFETEERLMQQYGYEQAEAEQAREHIRQHREFSARMVEIRAQKNMEDRETRVVLLEFLNDWLMLHICNIDQRLAKFIKDKDRKESEL